VDRVANSPLMRPTHYMIASDDLPGLAARLLDPDDSDPVTEYLRTRIASNTLALLEEDELEDAYSPALQALEDELLELKPQARDSFLAEKLVEEKYEKYPLNPPEPAVEVEEKERRVIIKDAGMKMAIKLMQREKILSEDQDLFGNETIGIHHMLGQALVAHHHYKLDDEYVVMNGQVLIVDEFTGRIMEGRRYSDGLHQALEAKEANRNPHSGVSVQFETQTIASITYQNYFKLYNKLAGMTGTARTEAGEFSKIYGLGVTPIPTNLPLGRVDMTDLIFATEEGKFKYIAREIEALHATGRPILVGTVSIEKSEHLAAMLAESGITEYQVLNAKHHAREATIIANAGKRGAITIATNMAGRGTDIKLAEGVRELGGLAVVGTERHESRRIDNQLRGRCGRQGDPGTTRFYVSLEDEVARLFGGDRVKKVLNWVGADQMDDEPLDQRMVSRSIEKAQKRVEEYNFEIREHLLKYAEVMNRQRTVIYEMRRSVLEARDISGQIRDMFERLVQAACDEYAPQDTEPDEWDLEGLGARLFQLFGFEPELTERDAETPLPLVDDLIAQVMDEYERREENIEQYLRESYREQVGGDESTIDFAKMSRAQIRNYERMALLWAVDEKWIDHLHSMDYLRESVRLRAFGQKDPLLEYKAEGFELFENMLNVIDQDVTQILFRLTSPEVLAGRRRQGPLAERSPAEDPFAQLSGYTYVAADKQADRSFASFDTSRFALAGQQDAAAQNQPQPGGTATATKAKLQPVRVGPKTKPNDPCPCGSGKKYKKCCGASADN
jgi:preprotein translocase subunit SecA